MFISSGVKKKKKFVKQNEIPFGKFKVVPTIAVPRLTRRYTGQTSREHYNYSCCTYVRLFIIVRSHKTFGAKECSKLVTDRNTFVVNYNLVMAKITTISAIERRRHRIISLLQVYSNGVMDHCGISVTWISSISIAINTRHDYI